MSVTCQRSGAASRRETRARPRALQPASSRCGGSRQLSACMAPRGRTGGAFPTGPAAGSYRLQSSHPPPAPASHKMAPQPPSAWTTFPMRPAGGGAGRARQQRARAAGSCSARLLLPKLPRPPGTWCTPPAAGSTGVTPHLPHGSPTPVSTDLSPSLRAPPAEAGSPHQRRALRALLSGWCQAGAVLVQGAGVARCGPGAVSPPRGAAGPRAGG